MENRNTYSYDTVKKLSFVRFGGTQEELRAAELIQSEIASFGGESTLMEFNIPAYRIEKCRMEVTAPFRREIPCVGYGRSGELPEGGVDLKLKYIELDCPAAYYGLEDLSEYAVLVNSPLSMDLYRELTARHAGAILVIAPDKWYNTPETTDLTPRAMRDTMLTFGKIPAFGLRSKDAMEMVRDGAEKVRLELRQEEMENPSRDVLAVIPGTEITNESVILTAHYDSVLVGTGSWDNATGAATLLYLYEHFLTHPPKRTMRFLWCGSEEQGLLGSKAFVAQNPDLLGSIRFCFNFDMCGTILGRNELFITGGEDLKTLCQALCDEAGYPAELHTGVHSSDSAPFADNGIPAVGLSRGTRTGEIHTRYDLIDILSPEKLKENAEFAIFFIRRFVDSVIFPVKREQPEDMKQELDKYFKRDKLAKEEAK